jgi:hypothetical protein
VSDFSSTQLCVFLDKLGEGEAFRPNTAAALDKVYSLNQSENAEIKLRFFKIALQSGPEYAQEAAGELYQLASDRAGAGCRLDRLAINLISPKLCVRSWFLTPHRLAHFQGPYEVLSCKLQDEGNWTKAFKAATTVATTCGPGGPGGGCGGFPCVPVD